MSKGTPVDGSPSCTKIDNHNKIRLYKVYSCFVPALISPVYTQLADVWRHERAMISRRKSPPIIVTALAEPRIDRRRSEMVMV